MADELIGIFPNWKEIDVVLDGYGFILTDTEFTEEDSDARLLGDVIFVKKGLEKIHREVCALHELGHHLIHAKCIGYRITDKVMVLKKERQADTFAALVLFPSLEEYDSEREFIMQSGLPDKTARLRINFFRRTGI